MNAALVLALGATARLSDRSTQAYRSTPAPGLIEVTRDAVSRKLHSYLSTEPAGEIADVATIAHEIRQPLTAIVMSANAGLRFLDRSTPNLEKAREALQRIVADGHRAGAVVESIRTSFRNPPQNTSSLDVNEVIQESISLERADLQKYRITVKAESDDHLPRVRGKRVQLQQVLLNLISNAIEAMADREEPRVLCVKSEVWESADVVISVADTGEGVRAEDVDRIFNPLFTTKSDGMGMGLSICRALIEAHGGRLWYAPNSPRGAIFQFTLRAG